MVGQPLRLAARDVPVPQQPPTDGGAGLLRQAAVVLADYRSEALAIWVWRLEQRSAPCPWPQLRLTDVLRDVPILVETVLDLLPASPAERPAPRGDFVERVRQQVAARLMQGAPLATVLNEQALLRDELWMLFSRRL